MDLFSSKDILSLIGSVLLSWQVILVGIVFILLRLAIRALNDFSPRQMRMPKGDAPRPTHQPKVTNDEESMQGSEVDL